MSFDFNDSPGWVAAVAREREIRESAYLGLPYPIAGGAIMLQPLTLRQQMILYAARNPFVCGGPIHPSDAMAVLWVIQPEYAPTNIEGRDAFLARLEAADLPWATVVKELATFIEESTLDAPRPSKRKTSSCGGGTGRVRCLHLHRNVRFSLWLGSGPNPKQSGHLPQPRAPLPHNEGRSETWAQRRAALHPRREKMGE